jgi:hypothetical protein
MGIVPRLTVCLIYLLPHLETGLLELTQQAQQQLGPITSNLEIENLLAAPGTNLQVVLVKKIPVGIITPTTFILTMALEVVLVKAMLAMVMAVVAMAREEITRRPKAAWVLLEECQCRCRCLLHRTLPMGKERPMGVGIDHNLPQTGAVVVVVVRTQQEQLL